MISLGEPVSELARGSSMLRKIHNPEVGQCLVRIKGGGVGERRKHVLGAAGHTIQRLFQVYENKMKHSIHLLIFSLQKSPWLSHRHTLNEEIKEVGCVWNDSGC